MRVTVFETEDWDDEDRDNRSTVSHPPLLYQGRFAEIARIDPRVGL